LTSILHIHTLPDPTPIPILFPDTAAGLGLHTDIGIIAIDEAPRTKADAMDFQSPQHQRGAVSSDGAWITYNSENLVWLPSEYRPSYSAVSGKRIGIGVGSGRVWICNMEVNKLEGA